MMNMLTTGSDMFSFASNYNLLAPICIYVFEKMSFMAYNPQRCVVVLFVNVCNLAALYCIAQEAGKLRAYRHESTMWKIGTWETICFWVMEKNVRNGIHAL